MAYSFDTSALVGPWRRHYRPKSFPSFWGRLESSMKDGAVSAVDEVREELQRQDDELLEWVEARSSDIFVPVSSEIQLAVREILKQYPRLVDNRKNRSGADPFVIAHDQVNNLTVVTTEVPTGSPKKPHIPDVCVGIGIRCFGLSDFIEECDWVF